MRLRPRSLWAQLATLLIGVLLIAQLLSAALHFRDRGELLVHAAGFNTSERISGITRLLDSLDPEHRAAAVRALDLPPLRMHLTAVPEPLPAGNPKSPRARLFHRLLHYQLGEERTILVRVIEPEGGSEPDITADWGPPMGGSPHARMMHGRMMGLDVSPGPKTSFLVQVPLSQGQWVTFAYFLPETLAAWPWDLFLALMVLLVAVLLVSFFAVRWLIRPLSVLASAADELGRDIESAPLKEEGPVEVRRAARAFNTMQRRLTRFVEERTRILAAVSHDLKTPITRMRLRLEGMEHSPIKEKFDRDLLDMQAMVQASLDFMRGMAIKEPTRPIDMEALLESLADDAHDLGREVSVTGEAMASYPGKPLALKRCLGNLLDNAVRYGGAAEVVIRDGDGGLLILVRDDGPGLADEELERVFEPFYRVERSRNPESGGTGLGLSIARNIARAHGGDLTLHNRSDAPGLDAVLSLPR